MLRLFLEFEFIKVWVVEEECMDLIIRLGGGFWIFNIFKECNEILILENVIIVELVI